MTWGENSAPTLEASESEQSIKGAYKEGKRGSDNPPPRKKSPWRAALIGAVIGLALFAILVAILSYVFGRFH